MTRPSPDLRRQLRLPPAEEDAFVDEGWEAIDEGRSRWVLVHGAPSPESIDIPTDCPDDPVNSLAREDK